MSTSSCPYNALKLTNGTCVQCSFNQYPDTNIMSCVNYQSLYDKVANDRALTTDDINAGNTAYVIICSVLVLLMLPGLALYYGALSAEGNVINTVLLSFTSMVLISLSWILLGYSLAFGPGDSSFLGNAEWGAFTDIGAGAISAVYGDKIPHVVFALFQNMFNQITPAIMSGAIAGRVRFSTYCVFIVIWSLIVYCPICRWMWALKIDEVSGETVPAGFLGQLGAIDGAGGTVIHIAGGASAAAASLVIGPRIVRQDVKPDVTKLLTAISLLYGGWFGFNSGSALAANAVAGGAAVVTHFATCASIATWMVLEYLHEGIVSFTGMCSACVIGLVTITPCCLFVTAPVSLAIGSIGAIVCYLFHQLQTKTFLNELFDDASVTRDHGVAGFVGVVLVGIFAQNKANSAELGGGAVDGNGNLVAYQLAAAVTSTVWSFVITAVLMLVLKYTIGIRVSEDEELFGLDRAHDNEETTKDNARAPTDEEEPFTMIFTDIESSSKIWSKNHSLMAKAVDKHNKVIRRVLDRYCGYEVKIIGDSFMCCFKGEYAANAVRFCADLQVELNNEDWDDKGKLNYWYQKWNDDRALAASGNVVPTTHSTSSTRDNLTKSIKTNFSSANNNNNNNDPQESNNNNNIKNPTYTSTTSSKKSTPTSRSTGVSNPPKINNNNNSATLFSQNNSLSASHPAVIHAQQQQEVEEDNTTANKETANAPNNNTSTAPNSGNLNPPQKETSYVSILDTPNNNNYNNNTNHPSSNSVANTSEATFPTTATNTVIGAGAFPSSSNLSTSAAGNGNAANVTGQVPMAGLRVRVGCHYGYGNIIWNQTIKRNDYLGTVCNSASRIESLGHGGQTLVSKEAWDAAVKQDPTITSEYIHLNLGSHSLRGIRGTTTIFQLSHPSLSMRKFAPLRTNIGGGNEQAQQRSRRSSYGGGLNGNNNTNGDEEDEFYDESFNNNNNNNNQPHHSEFGNTNNSNMYERIYVVGNHSNSTSGQHPRFVQQGGPNVRATMTDGTSTADDGTTPTNDGGENGGYVFVNARDGHHYHRRENSNSRRQYYYDGESGDEQQQQQYGGRRSADLIARSQRKKSLAEMNEDEVINNNSISGGTSTTTTTTTTTGSRQLRNQAAASAPSAQNYYHQNQNNRGGGGVSTDRSVEINSLSESSTGQNVNNQNQYFGYLGGGRNTNNATNTTTNSSQQQQQGFFSANSSTRGGGGGQQQQHQYQNTNNNNKNVASSFNTGSLNRNNNANYNNNNNGGGDSPQSGQFGTGGGNSSGRHKTSIVTAYQQQQQNHNNISHSGANNMNPVYAASGVIPRNQQQQQRGTSSTPTTGGGFDNNNNTINNDVMVHSLSQPGAASAANNRNSTNSNTTTSTNHNNNNRASSASSLVAKLRTQLPATRNPNHDNNIIISPTTDPIDENLHARQSDQSIINNNNNNTNHHHQVHYSTNQHHNNNNQVTPPTSASQQGHPQYVPSQQSSVSVTPRN